MTEKMKIVNKINAYTEIINAMKALSMFTENLVGDEVDMFDKVVDFTLVYNTTMSLIKKHGETDGALYDEPMKFIYSDFLRTMLSGNGEFSRIVKSSGLVSNDDFWSITVDRDILRKNINLTHEIFSTKRFFPIFITVIMGDEKTAFHERINELKRDLN